jgi:hypothetical protein
MLRSTNASFMPAQWVVRLTWRKRFYRVDARRLAAVRGCEAFTYAVACGTGLAISHCAFSGFGTPLHGMSFKTRLLACAVWTFLAAGLRFATVATVAADLQKCPEAGRRDWPYVDTLSWRSGVGTMLGIALWWAYAFCWRLIF